jgi:hypothetical protein
LIVSDCRLVEPGIVLGETLLIDGAGNTAVFESGELPPPHAERKNILARARNFDCIINYLIHIQCLAVVKCRAIHIGIIIVIAYPN